MNRLISDISQASRVDAALAKEAVQTLDLNHVLASLCDLYGPILNDEKLSIKRSVLPEPAYIRAYETSFAQVLRNLIDNALTFSSEGGTIFLRLKSDGETVQIHVEDEGPGIPPDNLETVFERFYTERPKGAAFGSHSGLGLAICRQIVDAHNGRIWAENRQDSGARFIVELPLQKVEKPTTGRRRAKAAVANQALDKNNSPKAA